MDFTQYQHYVPQFMLRRFAATQPIGLSKVSASYRKSERQRRKNNASVKVLHLDRSPPEITNEFVRRTFGQQDMYNGGLGKRMEDKLGEIERKAARVIARVVDAHEAGKEGILLVRSEKDLLRKFQFVMKYRSPIFFRRFNHQTAEDYNSNDKEEFLEYMRAKDFQSPLEVWFDNLTKMIDIRMDPDCHWIEELRETIYPPDADWFVANIRSMYMAFVTPSDPQEEFILTENAFSIHEGPVSYSVDRFTGEEKQIAYTEFHLLTVISPRLAIVFRSNDMPEPLEDLLPGLRERKLGMLAAIALVHTDPEHATSLLEDLPIAKARNSYTTVRNGCLELAEGADGKPRMNDKFDFIFFRLESNHAQKINMVMLDQAYNIDELVFKSKAGLRKALEFYLEYPCLTRGLYSMKTVSDKPDDPRLRFLKKMEHVARMLGSSTTAKYHVDPLWEDNETMPLEIAVAQVLATTTDTPEKDPIVLGTEILINTQKKMKTNITVKNGSDQFQDNIGRHMERKETPSSAQSPADQSFSHLKADIVEGNEESNSAQRSEEMETKGGASLDNALTAAPVVLPNNRDSDDTLFFWILAISASVLILPALPLVGLAFIYLCLALGPVWLAWGMGMMDLQNVQKPVRSTLPIFGFYMFGVVLWWFACYRHLLLDELPFRHMLPEWLARCT
ncbi:hypothetical protein GGP41_005627 [Bipolaris sorokiniana]|uniref:Uncharacterized protein n=1 Tax=Cochliobolus sativus TaxID=45130 RepID=A0A8H6DTV9_COCSA|nr:hypothetical protein GGP41_005627 [Bipolaris sorokiniana]